MKFGEIPSSLLKSDGSVDKVAKIDKGESFENGTFGSVYESDVTVSKNGKERVYSFVVKEFKEQGAAEHAFKSYEKLKGIGIRVPSTYRLDKENNRIVMTSYNLNNMVALSASSGNEHVSNLKISSISNMERLESELENQCLLAASKRIRLPIDAFFFLVDKNGGIVNMNFVIGDLDLIYSEYAKELNLNEEDCLAENKRNANEALQTILMKYMK